MVSSFRVPVELAPIVEAIRAHLDEQARATLPPAIRSVIQPIPAAAVIREALARGLPAYAETLGLDVGDAQESGRKAPSKPAPRKRPGPLKAGGTSGARGSFSPELVEMMAEVHQLRDAGIGWAKISADMNEAGRLNTYRKTPREWSVDSMRRAYAKAHELGIV